MRLVALAARAVLMAMSVRSVAVRVAVPMAVPVVGVPMAAQDEEDDDVDAHPDQRQDEHHCTPIHAPECHQEYPNGSLEVQDMSACTEHACMHAHVVLANREAVGLPLPLTGEGLMMRLTASYRRMPVTSQVLSTDASAPSTSMRWYLHRTLQTWYRNRLNGKHCKFGDAMQKVRTPRQCVCPYPNVCVLWLFFRA